MKRLKQFFTGFGRESRPNTIEPGPGDEFATKFLAEFSAAGFVEACVLRRPDQLQSTFYVNGERETENRGWASAEDKRDNEIHRATYNELSATYGNENVKTLRPDLPTAAAFGFVGLKTADDLTAFMLPTPAQFNGPVEVPPVNC